MVLWIADSLAVDALVEVSISEGVAALAVLCLGVVVVLKIITKIADVTLRYMLRSNLASVRRVAIYYRRQGLDSSCVRIASHFRDTIVWAVLCQIGLAFVCYWCRMRDVIIASLIAVGITSSLSLAAYLYLCRFYRKGHHLDERVNSMQSPESRATITAMLSSGQRASMWASRIVSVAFLPALKWSMHSYIETQNYAGDITHEIKDFISTHYHFSELDEISGAYHDPQIKLAAYRTVVERWLEHHRGRPVVVDSSPQRSESMKEVWAQVLTGKLNPSVSGDGDVGLRMIDALLRELDVIKNAIPPNNRRRAQRVPVVEWIILEDTDVVEGRCIGLDPEDGAIPALLLDRSKDGGGACTWSRSADWAKWTAVRKVAGASMQTKQRAEQQHRFAKSSRRERKRMRQQLQATPIDSNKRHRAARISVEHTESTDLTPIWERTESRRLAWWHVRATAGVKVGWERVDSQSPSAPAIASR